jgi:hypothetical protein
MINKIKDLKIVCFTVAMLLISCNKERNLYPNEITGYLQLLAPEKTGIDFNNAIHESETINHFYYSQIYNGAGVAIGDINNDGLPDVFFCGNMVSDRLYLNKGNFKFEDITKSSRAAVNSGWSWGVTMADVNADGYLDIYVSRNGESLNPNDRINQLYINNQDLTFTESAMLYGLADAGFSTQAVFFDMDNDGDLDMYQVNQPPDPKLFSRFKIPSSQQRFDTDKLYKNENGKYKDVSKDVGISNALAHGLSVNSSDFNNDGWMDLYVANDYDEPDFMYYNNGDGTFRNVINENLKHISKFSMGSDTGDINNDGFIDLMTLDMAAEDHYRSKTNMGSMSSKSFNQLVEWGKHYQYMFNTLQINSGKGSFYDVGYMAGLAKTDWSWSTLIVDLDNDGQKDILVTNGIKKDFRNNDFLAKAYQKLANGSIDIFNLSKQAPSSPLSNYIFRNKGGLEFEKVAKEWGFDTPGFSSGVAYGDLDNDGDLDIITNNMDAPAFVYENKATGNYLKINFKGSDKNKFGYGAKVTIKHNGKIQIAENTVTRGYLSSVEPGVFFGLGKETKIDQVEIVWADGKITDFHDIKANTTLTAKYSNAKLVEKEPYKAKTLFSPITASELGITFVHKENEFDDFAREILLPYKLSQNGPFSAVADVNGDELDDIFIGGASGQSGILYLQDKNGLFTKSSSQPWEQDAVSEDMECLFLDVDGDNDKDLFVTSGGSEFKEGSIALQNRIYLNNGHGEFSKDNKALPQIYESSQNVEAADIDADGDLDLFVGTRLIPGKYLQPASSYMLINNNGKFTDLTSQIVPALQNIGMVTDAVFTDVDSDNDLDLIVVGEWMKIVLLENQNGVFIDSSKKWGLDDNTRGLWWSITASDLDNDGDDDYILGNLGRNNKFKASEEHPFKVYAGDFDRNGTNDVLLANFYKEDYVPVRGKECTSQQMPFINEKFKDYNSFAMASMGDILSKEEMENAVKYEISNFESIILINDGHQLIRKPLAIQAQTSPIKSSLVEDFNNDGFKDIMVAGNHYATEVETIRYDSGIGTVLMGDGKNNFQAMAPTKNGFYVPYDSRNIELIKGKNKNYVLITNNNSVPILFAYKK